MSADPAEGIATPSGNGGFVAGLLAEQHIPAALARLGASVAASLDQPVRIGARVIVARHGHVLEALARDLDFRIAPVNAARIDAVNGPFVLGMDRDATLAHERQALYAALAGVDLAALRARAAEHAETLVDAADQAIDVVEDFARPVASATARRLFGALGGEEGAFRDAARAIFAHVFLNVSGDKAIEARALRAGVLLRGWLAAEIAARRAAGDLGRDMMGMLLRGGMLDDDGVRRTLGGMLVGAIDTTASAVAKIIAVLGRDPALARRVAADAGDAGRLAGWCREALRAWPHNPVLLRQAQTDTTLAGAAVRAGDQIVLWTQAAMRDAAAFPRPNEWRPDRPASAYLHLGGGLHPCAGRAVNDFQIPLLVGALLRRGIGAVGPVEWAGPFPAHLHVRFGR